MWEVQYLFLMRPTQITDVPTYFNPLIGIINKSNIKVIFLSVQCADKMSYVPHSKIEKLIKNNDIPYIFVRPSYFMSNLTTTLYDEINQTIEYSYHLGSLSLTGKMLMI